MNIGFFIKEKHIFLRDKLIVKETFPHTSKCPKCQGASLLQNQNLQHKLLTRDAKLIEI